MRPIDDRTQALPDNLIARLYERSRAEHWSIARDRFAEAVRRSVDHRCGPGAPTLDPEALHAYLDTLHVEDLALACACRDGNEAAWTHFVREIQPQVRSAGRAMAGDQGEELADGLIAELFGTTVRDGERRSLLDYFHGRSRLTTWLRTVLAQRHIDRLRVSQREVPFEAPGHRGGVDAPGGGRLEPGRTRAGFAESAARAQEGAALAADRPRLLAAFQQEFERAVNELNAGDRLRLACYHVDGLTLARIGRLVGEHESSVSRKLDRARRQVRERVQGALRERHGLGEADMRQCYEDAGRHGTMDMTRLFRNRPTQPSPPGPGEQPVRPTSQDGPRPPFKVQDVP